MDSIRTSTIVLAVLTLLCTPISGQIKIIGSPQVTNRGVWGPMEYCPKGSIAIQFRVKYEGYFIGNDDTALNAIQLQCQDIETESITTIISSTEGFFGEWSPYFLPTHPRGCQHFVGFILKSEIRQGSGDDTAANEIQFKCATGDWVRSTAGRWGEWTDPQYCDKGQAICGIQTQVEPPQGIKYDDTSLNNVRFACCDCPLCPQS